MITSPITITIVLITIVVSLVAFERRDIMHRLMFNPYVVDARKQWYRFFSHGFIHADYVHLGVNMLVLFSFGIKVENDFKSIFESLGNIVFILLYVAAIGVASISTYIKYRNHPGYNSLGASGATSAVLFASILMDPWGTLAVYFIPMPGIVFGIVYLIYSSYMGRRGGDYINHDAHFYGAVFGIVYPLALKPELGKFFIMAVREGLGLV